MWQALGRNDMQQYFARKTLFQEKFDTVLSQMSVDARQPVSQLHQLFFPNQKYSLENLTFEAVVKILEDATSQ